MGQSQGAQSGHKVAGTRGTVPVKTTSGAEKRGAKGKKKNVILPPSSSTSELPASALRTREDSKGKSTDKSSKQNYQKVASQPKITLKNKKSSASSPSTSGPRGGALAKRESASGKTANSSSQKNDSKFSPKATKAFPKKKSVMSPPSTSQPPGERVVNTGGRSSGPTQSSSKIDGQKSKQKNQGGLLSKEPSFTDQSKSKEAADSNKVQPGNGKLRITANKTGLNENRTPKKVTDLPVNQPEMSFVTNDITKSDTTAYVKKINWIVPGPMTISASYDSYIKGEDERTLSTTPQITPTLHRSDPRQSHRPPGGVSDLKTKTNEEPIGEKLQQKPKLSLAKKITSLLDNLNFDQCEPDLCVNFLKNPSMRIYSALKKKLKSCSGVWLESFLDASGLEVLMDAVDTMGNKRVFQLADAMLLLECVACVKAVINSKIGLEFLIEHKDHTRTFAKALDTTNVVVKKQVFELLSALCVYSPEGLQRILDALDAYKVAKNQRYRFSLIVYEMKRADVTSYWATLMGFVNCLILAHEDLDERVKVRSEFIGLGLLETLSLLREETDEDLLIQLELFDEEKLADDEEVTQTKPLGLDLNNHQEVFNAVFLKVCNTPQAEALLNILRTLLLVDPNSQHSKSVTDEAEKHLRNQEEGDHEKERSDTGFLDVKVLDGDKFHQLKLQDTGVKNDLVWSLMESLVEKAATVSSSQEGDRLLRDSQTSAIPASSCKTCDSAVQTLPESFPGKKSNNQAVLPVAVSVDDVTISVSNCDNAAPPAPPLPPSLATEIINYGATASRAAPPAPPLPDDLAAPAAPLTNGTVIPPPPPLPPGLAESTSPQPSVNCSELQSVPPPLCSSSSAGSPPPPPLPPGLSSLPPAPPAPPLPNGIPPPPAPPPPSFGGGPPPPPPPLPNGIAPPLPPTLGGGPPPPAPPFGGPPPPPPPMGVGSGPPPPPTFGAGPPIASSNPLAPVVQSFLKMITGHKPKSKMKTINWTKVPPKLASKDEAVWKEVLAMEDPVQVNYKIVEDLFCQKLTKTTTSSSDKPKKISTEINLLDTKRSMNVNIFIKQFRASNAEIIEMLRQGDAEKIGAEKLKGLLKILPEQDEIQMLKSFEGDREKLGPAEKFFLLMLELPAYRMRITGMVLKVDFRASYDTLMPDIEALSRASEGIRKSKSLKEFLRFALHTGNFMNAGGYAGNAAGFKLASLTKLAETRANKPRMTLLHFLVQEAENENKSILDFAEELLPDLTRASRLVLDALTSDVKQLQTGIDKLSNQLKNVDPDLQEQFSTFVKGAGKEVKQLLDGLDKLENYKKKLARHFCEENKTFQLEDCLTIFKTVCENVKKCQQENKQRKIQEERAAKRKEQQKIVKSKKDVPLVQEEVCIIDNLLNDIRQGYPLRRTSTKKKPSPPSNT